MCSEHFLLMDEPFSGLDYASKQKTCEAICLVAGSDELNTIIISTHDIETAVQAADTLWLMGREKNDKGEVIPGARIIEKVDLIEMGLAWQPGVELTSEFSEFIRRLQVKFIDPVSPYS